MRRWHARLPKAHLGFELPAIQAAGYPLLDPELPPNFTDQWTWMGRYRVWEAHRKVFLHPENWLVPELRDDKTELFEEFEQFVSSGPLNAERSEQALITYMRGLDELSRLEICGQYTERNAEGSNEVGPDYQHVFGRSRGQSGVYYYRRAKIVGSDEYTPPSYEWENWQKLPFEVDSPDVLPVVYQGRLMLLWMRVQQSSDGKRKQYRSEPKNWTIPYSSTEGQRDKEHYKVWLAWSQYHKGEWSDVQESEDSLIAVYVMKSPLDAEDLKQLADHPEDGILDVAAAYTDRHQRRPASPAQIFLYSDVSVGGDSLAVHVGFVKNRHTHFLHAGKFHFDSLKSPVRREPDNISFEELERPENMLMTSQGFSAQRLDELRLLQRQRGASRSFIGRPILLEPPELEVQHGRQNAKGIKSVFFVDQPVYIQDARRCFYLDRVEGEVIPPAYDLSLDESAPRDALGVSPVRFLSADEQLQFVGRSASRPTERYNSTTMGTTWRPTVAYHPFTCLLISQLEQHGVEGIYRPDPDSDSEGVSELVHQSNQRVLFSDNAASDAPYTAGVGLFKLSDDPAHFSNYEIEEFEFRFGKPYAAYNWEIFYHIPMYMADRLMKNFQFAEAQRWLGFIFAPNATGSHSADAVWNIKPFATRSPWTIEELLLALNGNAELVTTDEAELKDLNNEAVLLSGQLEHARDNPFSPHLLARLRKTPYMRAAFFKYIDVLIRWGDHLFRQETIESLNEALLQYAQALRLLGRRPVAMPNRERDAANWQEIGTHVDTFGNAIAPFENLLWAGERERKQNRQLANGPRLSLDYSIEQSHPTCEGQLPTYRIQTLGLRADDQLVNNNHGYAAANVFPMSFIFAADTTDATGRSLYFCIPGNDQALGMWDTLEDRLYKLRNCLSINGRGLNLALFEPPLDPGALISALGSGQSLINAIAEFNTPAPGYRFQTYLGLAQSLAGDLETLSSRLLSALERKDAEALAQLRAVHEVELLDLNRRILESQLEQSEHSLEVADASLELAQRQLDEVTGREDRSSLESRRVTLQQISVVLEYVAGATSIAAGILSVIGKTDGGGKGVPGTPMATQTVGGSGVGGVPNPGESTPSTSAIINATRTASRSMTPASASAMATQLSQLAQLQSRSLPGRTESKFAELDASGMLSGDKAGAAIKDSRKRNGRIGLLSSIASMLNATAGALLGQSNLAATQGALERRDEDWAHETSETTREHKRAQLGVNAATARLDAAQRNLERHDLARKQAEERRAFLDNKFTNHELFQWMADELSQLYFQSYELAHQLAKTAEKAYQLECFREGDSFITSGHWDSRYKGLLAGRRLNDQLKRLELAYYEHDQSTQDHELTKIVTLSDLDEGDGMMLQTMKDTGTLDMSVDISSYVDDFPSHYLRRIKGVSLSILCERAQNTSISAKLTLVTGQFVKDVPSMGAGNVVGDGVASESSIATSTSMSDSGMFELNFSDPRYLPFEHRGAISDWRVEVSTMYPQFDRSTIEDVVLTIHYTAREGGRDFGEAMKTAFAPVAPNYEQAFRAGLEDGLQIENWPDFGSQDVAVESLKLSDPAAFATFSSPSGPAQRSLSLSVSPQRFTDGTLQSLQVEPYLALIYSGDPVNAEVDCSLSADGTSHTLTLRQTLSGVMATKVRVGPTGAESVSLPAEVNSAPVNWNVELDSENVKNLIDIILVTVYQPDE